MFPSSFLAVAVGTLFSAKKWQHARISSGPMSGTGEGGLSLDQTELRLGRACVGQSEPRLGQYERAREPHVHLGFRRKAICRVGSLEVSSCCDGSLAGARSYSSVHS